MDKRITLYRKPTFTPACEMSHGPSPHGKAEGDRYKVYEHQYWMSAPSTGGTVIIRFNDSGHELVLFRMTEPDYGNDNEREYFTLYNHTRFTEPVVLGRRLSRDRWWKSVVSGVLLVGGMGLVVGLFAWIVPEKRSMEELVEIAVKQQLNL